MQLPLWLPEQEVEELSDRLVRFILYFSVMWLGDLYSAIYRMDPDGYGLLKTVLVLM